MAIWDPKEDIPNSKWNIGHKEIFLKTFKIGEFWLIHLMASKTFYGNFWLDAALKKKAIFYESCTPFQL